MATIPHSTPTRPQTRPQRRRKPDPARVVQSYYHQVQQTGKRGAYARTALLYGVSDETVRRYVLAAEQPKPRSTDPNPLDYVPPPDAYPEPLPAPKLATGDISTPQKETQTDADAICGNSATAEALPEPIEHVVMSNADPDQDATEDATRHTPELPEGSPEVPQAPQTSPGHARPEFDDPGSEMPNLPPESFPDPSPNQPTSPMELAPQLATRRGATYATSPMVRAFNARRLELVEVAPARHVGLLPALMASEYRGVWLGVLIWLGLMLLVAIG